ncbi:MAG: hypothetical protein HOP10_07725 [Chitinophagaceae bacterium]|nr:hypothetical protein [Chitinophagaceae bacterium]
MNKRHRAQGTRRKVLPALIAVLLVPCVLFLVSSTGGCKVHYGFKDKVGIPDTIKTVKIIQLLNNARYVNPQLSQRLTDKLRQKIVSQTKLTQTNGDNPDWEINGTITDYSFSTSAISGQQVVNNRLTVAIHITIIKHKDQGKIEDYDVSRSFEFKGDLSFQQAEAALGDEMIRTLADEIFNKLFSNW